MHPHSFTDYSWVILYNNEWQDDYRWWIEDMEESIGNLFKDLSQNMSGYTEENHKKSLSGLRFKHEISQIHKISLTTVLWCSIKYC
jgi:hypothetical protein